MGVWKWRGMTPESEGFSGDPTRVFRWPGGQAALLQLRLADPPFGSPLFLLEFSLHHHRLRGCKDKQALSCIETNFTNCFITYSLCSLDRDLLACYEAIGLRAGSSRQENTTTTEITRHRKPSLHPSLHIPSSEPNTGITIISCRNLLKLLTVKPFELSSHFGRRRKVG